MKGERVTLPKSRISMAVQAAFVWGMAAGFAIAGFLYASRFTELATK